MVTRSPARILAAIPLLFSAVSFSSAHAEESKSDAPFKVSGNFGVYTDYRFRGISLNDKRVAPQGNLAVTFNPGFYLTLFGSPNNLGGSEIDIGGGYSHSISNITYDFGAVSYIYPRAGEFSYYEIYGSVSSSLGPITPKIGFYWAPSQTAVRLGRYDPDADVSDNFYIYGGFTAAIPNTPFSINAQLGAESGAFAGRPSGSKIDWQLGISTTYAGFTLAVNYIDTNNPRNFVRTAFGTDAASATAVGSLTYNF